MANQNTQPVPKNQIGDNSETDMKEFYASPSHVYPKNTRLSAKTKKAIRTLQDLLSIELSFLLQPINSIAMKDTIEYLQTLPENEGISLTTKSEIQKLLQCFQQWSLEFHNASDLSESAEAELSKSSEVMTNLEANIKEFQEMDKAEKYLCNHFDNLQEEKRNLEFKIKIITIQMTDSTKLRGEIAKRKTELFQKRKVLKADRDKVTICVPKLKAEQEFALRKQAIIEEEWYKLGEQFIQSTGFKDWILQSWDTSN